MDFSIDMIDVGNADAFIIWVKINQEDTVIFIDGGNPGDGKKVIKHYQSFIMPHISEDTPLIIVNTHPHRDHIGGLIDILDYFGEKISRIYWNNPRDYLDKQRELGFVIYQTLFKENIRMGKFTNMFEDVKQFERLIRKYSIPTFSCFSDDPLDHSLFEIISPSSEFYIHHLNYFTSDDNLKSLVGQTIPESEVNEVEEGNKPCDVVDEKNDTSSENLTSVILQFTDSSGRKYLFTADAGVDSFESASLSRHDLKDFHICQLPHHGSRRNLNTNWVCKLNPKQFWVSAKGDKKHPRRAVIECIKKNLPDCKTYSTHKGGTKHINSKNSIFPERGWSSAKPL